MRSAPHPTYPSSHHPSVTRLTASYGVGSHVAAAQKRNSLSAWRRAQAAADCADKLTQRLRVPSPAELPLPIRNAAARSVMQRLTEAADPLLVRTARVQDAAAAYTSPAPAARAAGSPAGRPRLSTPMRTAAARSASAAFTGMSTPAALRGSVYRGGPGPAGGSGGPAQRGPGVGSGAGARAASQAAEAAAALAAGRRAAAVAAAVTGRAKSSAAAAAAARRAGASASAAGGGGRAAPKQAPGGGVQGAAAAPSRLCGAAQRPVSGAALPCPVPNLVSHAPAAELAAVAAAEGAGAEAGPGEAGCKAGGEAGPGGAAGPPAATPACVPADEPGEREVERGGAEEQEPLELDADEGAGATGRESGSDDVQGQGMP